MSYEIHFETPKIYQVHDRIYLEQEIRTKPPTLANLLSIRPMAWVNLLKYIFKRKLHVELPTEVDSLLVDGAELGKIEVTPSHLNVKMEKKCLVISNRGLIKEPTTIRVGMQFILPPDKLYNFLTAVMLDRTKKGNGYVFTFLVKNKRDWPIEYVKVHLEILTKKILKRVDFFGVNLETHEKRALSSENTTSISHIDRFERLASRTYQLEVKFRSEFDPDAQIEVYVNDSSLTKAESIAFIPGNMVEALKKFYALLWTLESEVWWFEKHVDKDCFVFLSEGLDKKKVKNIYIIGGPVHMNEQFKQFYDAFKRDMSSHNIDAEVRAVLDEKVLEMMHARFLFDQNRLYLVPSSNIASKKFDIVAPIVNVGDAQKTRSKIQEIWKNSTPISNWKKIEEKRKSLDPRLPF